MILQALVTIFCLVPTNILAEKALITVPIADLLSTPPTQIKPPLAPVDWQDGTMSCPRLHQALFNETVEILETTANSAKIRILNAFYLNMRTKQKLNKFWTAKKNLTSITKLDKSKIPPPIDYTKPSSINNNQTITLTTPWYCSQTRQIFSAGTRFATCPKQTTRNSLHVYCYDSQNNHFIVVKIPKKIALTNYKKKESEQRKIFVKLLQKWAQPMQKKQIPYVWGGCSFTHKLPTYEAQAIHTKRNNQESHHYVIPNNKLNPQAGFDCAGLVLRAAQASSIPYFYKNTSTLADSLQSLKKNDSLQAGDLIWLSGHVIIVVDPVQNLCLEARDYGQGYGKVHTIHVSKLFKETPTLAKLKVAYYENKVLTRIDKKGNIRGKYQIKLLKLLS